jgi:hypothetical protein
MNRSKTMSESNVIHTFSEALEKRRLKAQQPSVFRSAEDRQAFLRTLRLMARQKQGLQPGEKKLAIPKEVRLARKRGNKRAILYWMVEEGRLL